MFLAFRATESKCKGPLHGLKMIMWLSSAIFAGEGEGVQRIIPPQQPHSETRHNAQDLYPTYRTHL